jgi:diguanylate cyclase (GGDEF)-like protein
VLPLCVVVVVAIGCIIIAALTSAQRADEVALEREKHLFVKAVVNRSDWSLRKLKAVLPMDASMRGLDTPHLQARLSAWQTTLMDHDILAVADAPDQISYSQAVDSEVLPRWITGQIPELRPLVEYLQGRTGTLPNGVLRLSDAPKDGRVPLGSETAFVQIVHSQPAIVAAVPLGPAAGSATATAESPPRIGLAVMFIDQRLLADIGGRLGLNKLRGIGGGEPSPEEFVLDLTGSRGETIARFAWTQRRPGAAVLESVVPFIGIAFAAFIMLAWMVLRFMRHTAATINAGENRLRYLALHDPLCGLPNRNFFADRLEAVITDVKNGGPPAAVFYIDLDHFKDVNDTLGHPIGDELIRSVTMRLSATVRGEDLVARLGGDEFAIITSASSDHAALQTVATRIISKLCSPYSINGHSIVIGASIGIAVMNQRSENEAADILRYADMALYRAKNEGRNRACIYDEVMDADLSNRKQLETDLREAIDNDKLDVLYQPIVNASGETVIQVEALARWRHPTRGSISPAEFIPIAEHSGLIIGLGATVLRRACLDAKAWPGIMLAVNVSPLQFRQLDFVDVIENILHETGFDPKRLELELTESTLLGNVEIAESAMIRLKALGIRLALDDFGTGYSSLHYLRRFPFDKLKIDRSFVLSIEKTADAAAIVHAIVSLGRGLGMKVTAEGVETAEQHLFLRAAGVHYMQGYRFGAAIAPASITTRIATPGIYRSIESDAAAALAS